MAARVHRDAGREGDVTGVCIMATRQYKVLLAEDSAADVGIVRAALRHQALDQGLQVVRAGAEAIAFIEHADKTVGPPGLDLLLLDMQLPKYNGEEILKRLRSTEYHAQTSVVIMTSSDAREDRARAEKHGALFDFQKPSRLDEFIQLGSIVRDILSTETGRGTGEQMG
jgi:CheY-like chemotaxis protein